VDTLTGRKIDKLLWKQGKIGRFTNGSISLSTSFRSKAKDDRKDEDRLPVDETLTPDEQQRQLDYIRENPADFVDFNVPWSMQLSFSLSYSKYLSPSLRNFVSSLHSSVNISGDYSITPKWKAIGNAYFDFKTRKIEPFMLTLTREMHCWQMSISVQIGNYKSFSLVLNPKSGLLRDLKINRSRSFVNSSSFF